MNEKPAIRPEDVPSNQEKPRRLKLNRDTVRNLTVKTHMRAGSTGADCTGTCTQHG